MSRSRRPLQLGQRMTALKGRTPLPVLHLGRHFLIAMFLQPMFSALQRRTLNGLLYADLNEPDSGSQLTLGKTGSRSFMLATGWR